MFGTIGKWQVKDGHMDAFLDVVRGYQPPSGFISMTIYHSTDDPKIVYGAVVFESKDAYQANAESEAQHTFYTKTLAHLDKEPEWMDGDIVMQFD